MSPISSLENRVDSVLTYAEFARQSCLASAYRQISMKNFFHLLCCEFGCTPAFAICMSLFHKHIMVVFSESPKKQVVRVHARRIIAMVTNALSIRNRAIVQLPREAMGGYHPMLSRLLQPTIAFNNRTSPQPTSLSLLNLCPKTLFTAWSTSLAHACMTAKSAWVIYTGKKIFAAVFTYLWGATSKMRHWTDLSDLLPWQLEPKQGEWLDYRHQGDSAALLRQWPYGQHRRDKWLFSFSYGNYTSHCHTLSRKKEES